MDEQIKEKTDFFLVINKILQINKYMIYDNTTKKFVPKKQKEKNAKSTIEESFNSNKCKKNKNNTSVRNVSKLRKKKQLNVSKLKNLELKEEKSNLKPSINDISDYNSKNLIYSNHSNKKEKQKINFNNISYDTYKRYQTTSSNTRKHKLIKLNTLPSLHSFNQNFFQKKPDYNNNLKNNKLKNSISNHKKLIKSKLLLSSSTNNYLNDNTNNIKTPSIKLLEDIDLNNVKNLSNNNSNIIKKNKKINNRKNNNLTNSNFIKINENNFQVNYLKKIFKRKKTNNPTYYLNTNISNTNERFLNNVKKLKNFVSVEEIHIAFVKLIKNQYNLIENQENKKIRKRKNNNPDFSNKNSTVIYIKEQYL